MNVEETSLLLTEVGTTKGGSVRANKEMKLQHR